MNEKTDNALFGPTNNLYKTKTAEELINEIDWMDADNAASPITEIQEMHKSNRTRLLDFEKYKKEMISG